MVTGSQEQQAQRKSIVRRARGADGQPILNGIDYLEVAADRRTLTVYFIHDLPSPFTQGAAHSQPVPPDAPPLTAENIVIQGGTRIRSIPVEFAASVGNVLTVRVNAPGDRSTYTLRLVQSSSVSEPPEGFDLQLAAVEFVFQVDDFSEVDYRAEALVPAEDLPATPAIDYLAKDYASFQQLMLSRLAVTLPKWQERNPADLGMMLVELLAYAADQLSYYQDAVATEAYLGTARKRISIRRHARLLDYFVHSGRNARAWVALEVDPEADGLTLLGPSQAENRAGVRLLTRVTAEVGLNDRDYVAALNAGAQVFETLHEITLYASHNRMEFYTWGATQYSLAKGATQATLKDSGGLLQQQLVAGTVLILEEVRGLTTGESEDAEPTRRHAVRLLRVTPKQDRLAAEGLESGQTVRSPQRLVEIAWGAADALPFELRVASVVGGQPIGDISVARGNVVLVDHGRTLDPPEALSPGPPGQPYRPRLTYGPLTQQGHVHGPKHPLLLWETDANASATDTLRRLELRDVRPQIWLQEAETLANYWHPQPDLLVSDRFARDFVVELEEDGRARLRFGDNQLGQQPNPGTRFQARYRIGNGRVGNVGAEAIAHLYPAMSGIRRVRNPLPAEGGVDPEPLEQVRFQAPQAFRQRQYAVTEADYAALAQTFPGVQRARVTRRWTGSWSTLFITVDRQGGERVDAEFRQQLLAFLAPYQQAGHVLEVDNPRFVPLDLALTVYVKPDYFASAVRQLLLQAFSDQFQPNGQPGFFHPDRLTFAQPIYLSELVQTAMNVPGVLSVKVTRFQRLWQPPQGELEAGQISFDRLEIPLLRNDPTAPEDGRLAFDLQGGLTYE